MSKSIRYVALAMISLMAVFAVGIVASDSGEIQVEGALQPGHYLDSTGNFEYTLENGDATIVAISYEPNPVIPETLDGHTVVSLDIYSFTVGDMTMDEFLAMDLGWMTIPATVSYINPVISWMLEGYIVDDSNPNYTADSAGVLYNRSMTTLVAFPANSELPYYDMPDTVVTVGEYAFNDWALDDEADTHHLEVTLSSHLRTIEENGLCDVDLGDFTLSPSLNVAKKAFMGCEFDTLTIPSSIKTIPEELFSGCEIGTLIISDGVERIDTNAFVSASFTELTIPASVEYVGYEAFGFNTELKEVTIKGSPDLFASPFMGCYNADTLTLESEIPVSEFEQLQFTDDAHDARVELIAGSWAADVVKDLEFFGSTTYFTYTPTDARIDYVVNGGLSMKSEYVAVGTHFTPKDPVRGGYEFKGWFTDQALTQPFVDGTFITGDLTLYASWEVIIDAGGTGSSDDGDIGHVPQPDDSGSDNTLLIVAGVLVVVVIIGALLYVYRRNP